MKNRMSSVIITDVPPRLVIFHAIGLRSATTLQAVFLAVVDLKKDLRLAAKPDLERS